jgi:hypothetical protein
MIKIGDKFGRLTVLSKNNQKNNGYTTYKCICDCGKEHNARGRSLRSGQIKSCGCSKKGIKHKTYIRKKPRKYNILSQDGLSRKKIDRRNREKKKQLKKTIIIKFNNMCYFCNKTDNMMNAHHIKEHAIFPLLRYLVVNHVLLCKQCLEQLHAHFKYKPIPFYSHIAYISEHKHKYIGEVNDI